MTQENTIPQKTINNAISAYPMLFISLAFLLNKTEEHINNDFVKSHTKVAFMIHLGFLINYIIFISYGFLKEFSILSYSINFIIASGIFLFLFMMLLFGIYKASIGKIFSIGEMISIGKREKIIDINGDNKLDEKDKLTLILSYVPFVGYFIHGQYYQNKTIKDIVFLNMIISIVITLTYILGHADVALLFILFYIIFAVFSAINIISTNTIIGIKLPFIPTPEDKITLVKSFSKYLVNYFKNKEFIGIAQLKNIQKKKREEEEKYNTNILENKKDISLPKLLIYIPFINIIALAFLRSKQRFHIINGIFLSIIMLIIITLSYFYIINPKWSIFLLFPICFGIGYIKSRPAYKMPFVYEVFETLVKVKNIFSKSKKNIKEKRAEEHKTTFKVGEIKKD